MESDAATVLECLESLLEIEWLSNVPLSCCVKEASVSETIGVTVDVPEGVGGGVIVIETVPCEIVGVAGGVSVTVCDGSLVAECVTV